ncbi:MAG: hypothetical protein M1817_002731 [Caeruleum heppii]|nr:MAG: hypothetical protein M1817_002731 [Caeruleum heppii]
MSIAGWLDIRRRLTQSLYGSPYDLVTYLDRAEAHQRLDYHDLAAGDAYRALLLAGDVQDDAGEYHDQAEEALKKHCLDTTGERGRQDAIDGDKLTGLLNVKIQQAYTILIESLTRCGCLKSAAEMLNRAAAAYPDLDSDLKRCRDNILGRASGASFSEGASATIEAPHGLADLGWVRREVYPWNDQEPDRFSEASLAFLNQQMAHVAPQCEIQVTELPSLRKTETASAVDGGSSINRQLGMFAKQNIEPGEVLLDEVSLLTVNNRLHESLCDACSTSWASVPGPHGASPGSDGTAVVACDACDDILFCSRPCLERAQESYHPAVCGKDVDTIGREAPARESADALYLLLLGRALAMAVTQEVHPLELDAIKYIWGDFTTEASSDRDIESTTQTAEAGYGLPFSFKYSIVQPLHLLEKMDVDIYADLARTDLWIINTLYAKFRGTASARLSTRDGRPEVCGVHPMWCLANHSCDPNVQWEWAGEMKFWARQHRVDGQGGGVKEGEEVLNHYCDIELPVQERREWMVGSLGGICVCERCRREDGNG